MLEDICLGGRYQAEYLLSSQSDIVVDLCDLVLQKKSPKASGEAEKRVEMGGSATRAYFGPIVKILCHLVMCQHTSTISDDAPSFTTFEETSPPGTTREAVTSIRSSLQADEAR